MHLKTIFYNYFLNFVLIIAILFFNFAPMKENNNINNYNRILNNRNADLSIIDRFFFSIYCFHIIDLFASSKTFSEKLLIRFANIRV